MTLLVAETHTAYVCKECKEEYDYESDAWECCPDVAEITWYKCGDCEVEYEEEETADKCCSTKVEIEIRCTSCSNAWYGSDEEGIENAIQKSRMCCIESEDVAKWQCEGCEEVHGTREAAEQCCPNVEEKTVYECPLCEYRNDDKSKAMLHCQTLAKNP